MTGGVGRNPSTARCRTGALPETFTFAIQTMGVGDMPRPKKPLKLVRTMGLDERDPGRYGGRSEPKTPKLGAPSDFLGEHGREAWETFKSEIPWLMESDRALVEIACSLRARIIAGETVGVNALAQLRICISAMGGTPTDRSKVSAPADHEEDPANKFLN